MSVAISILVMLIMLSILTIVHEWGHFIAARIFKVKVTEFSIFMGPCIWSKTSKKSGTKYSIRALPIGGYCAFEDDQGNADAPDSLNSQKWYKRLVIFVAGVFLNIVLAFVITIIMLFFTGYQTNTISSVPEHTVMSVVGIEKGDKLCEINDHTVLTPTDYDIYSFAIQDKNDDPDVMDSHYTLLYEKKDGSELFCDIRKQILFTTEKDAEGNESKKTESYQYTVVTDDGKSDKKTYLLFSKLLEQPTSESTQIRCELNVTVDGKTTTEEVNLTGVNYNRLGGDSFTFVKTYNPFRIIGHSGKYLVSMVKSIYTSLFWLIDGTVGLEAVSGPVGLTTVVDDVVGEKSISFWMKLLTLMNMTALISVNLGVFNMLPFPGLDGFHVIFIIIELIRGGKKVSPKVQSVISTLGLVLLMALAVVIMFSDVFKIIS
ncbi:MAG: RIP metalloprotease RseP [Ruminococcaceae bacterium]|nr:RIP metalloprotease RseP [Oscillospiraceae bacterium]